MTAPAIVPLARAAADPCDEPDIAPAFGGGRQGRNGRDGSLHAFDDPTAPNTTWIRRS